MERPPTPIVRGLEVRKEKATVLLSVALERYGEIASMAKAVRDAEARELAKPPAQIDYAYLSALAAREAGLSEVADKINAVLERVTEMTNQIEVQRKDLADFLESATLQDRSEPTITS